MAERVNVDTQPRTVKQHYRDRNWSEYYRVLVDVGSLKVWIDEESIANGRAPQRPKDRGKPDSHSDLAIQTCLTTKSLSRQPYRATARLLNSLTRNTGFELAVHDRTHMSRRAASLSAVLPRRRRDGPAHVVVDSTWLKNFGKGESKVGSHGVSKRRTCCKIHLSVNESAKGLVGIEVTNANWRGSEVFASLNQIERERSQVFAHGACVTADTYATITFWPRKGAMFWGSDHPRDPILPKTLPGWQAKRDIDAICADAWRGQLFLESRVSCAT